MRVELPESNLTNPRLFLLYFAVDGVCAYRQISDGSWEEFAASPKAVSTDRKGWLANTMEATLKTGMEIHKAIEEITHV